MENFEKVGDKLYLIFTDLDGTLVDENYSWEKALSVLEEVKNKKIPVIYCSAKTKSEQDVIRNRMGVSHPFIAENGSAVYVPKGYFGKSVGEESGDYEIILLGAKFEEINEDIKKLKEKYKIKNFYSLTSEEVAEITGLDVESAGRAKKREFGETVVEADEEALEELKKKFNVVSGGRFMQVFGKGADKGKAINALSEVYKKFGEVVTVGIGNAHNDEAMLRVVDIPILVKNPDGNWADLKIDNLHKAENIGPAGWAEVVKKFVLGE
ncbi:MAG: HAD-IIB family hydrolase [Candidatus Aenigmarchaeota archaeon]|nr:HAD-IIB family hydrolase [Candidatus Aenigmarchaeota archaeon]